MWRLQERGPVEEAGGRQTVAMHPPSVTRLNMVRCYEEKKGTCNEVGSLHHVFAKSLKSCLSPSVPCAIVSPDHEFQIWGAQSGSSSPKQERSQQYGEMLAREISA